MRRQPFGIVRDGEPIQTYPLRRSIRTGISFDDVRVELGMIPEFEEREAAIFAGYSWKEWEQEKLSERAAAVACMRLSRMIDLHSHDAAMRDRERKEKARGNV